MILDNQWDACSWGSHLPSLLACCGATSGPVLEIGVGHFSTPALHALCVSSGRKLISVEQDAKWSHMFKEKFENNGHEFVIGEYDDVLPRFANDIWSVVFIDNSPGGARRAKDFLMFIKNSDYVVVHDYHKDNEEHIGPLVDKHTIESLISAEYQPPTLVASSYRNLPKGLV